MAIIFALICGSVLALLVWLIVQVRRDAQECQAAEVEALVLNTLHGIEQRYAEIQAKCRNPRWSKEVCDRMDATVLGTQE